MAATTTPSAHIVLAVENESVPTDRRMWNHAVILRDAGYRVTVICPIGEGRDEETELELDGVSIRRFPLDRATGGPKGYLAEYSSALRKMAGLLRGLGPVDALHCANPPDFLFLLGLVPKLRGRTKIVFDHHDLSPELFESRFKRGGALLKATTLLERINFAAVDAVISTNETYRSLAIERGKMKPERVWVVRNARDRSSFTPVPVEDELKRGKPLLGVYVGTMGPQDGALEAVQVAANYRHELGRDDLHVVMVGDGDAKADCERLAKERNVEDMVEFVGWQDRSDVIRYLSSADIGLATDPPNPLNSSSTMIKVIEYLAMGLPVVSFDLTESVVTAGDAALYSKGTDIAHMATNLERLATDPDLRASLSKLGLERSQGPLSWETARSQLLDVYQTILR